MAKIDDFSSVTDDRIFYSSGIVRAGETLLSAPNSSLIQARVSIALFTSARRDIR